MKTKNIFYKRRIVGCIRLLYNLNKNCFTVFGELSESPRLQCEKDFKSKIIAYYNFYKLKYSLKRTFY